MENDIEIEDWKTMETAPRDGRLFIGWGAGLLHTCLIECFQETEVVTRSGIFGFFKETKVKPGGCYLYIAMSMGKMVTRDWSPTHWKPMPPSPTA